MGIRDGFISLIPDLSTVDFELGDDLGSISTEEAPTLSPQASEPFTPLPEPSPLSPKQSPSSQRRSAALSTPLPSTNPQARQLAHQSSQSLDPPQIQLRQHPKVPSNSSQPLAKSPSVVSTDALSPPSLPPSVSIPVESLPRSSDQLPQVSQPLLKPPPFTPTETLSGILALDCSGSVGMDLPDISSLDGITSTLVDSLLPDNGSFQSMDMGQNHMMIGLEDGVATPLTHLEQLPSQPVSSLSQSPAQMVTGDQEAPATQISANLNAKGTKIVKKQDKPVPPPKKAKRGRKPKNQIAGATPTIKKSKKASSGKTKKGKKEKKEKPPPDPAKIKIRAQRNRESAEKSRVRRKIYIDGLKADVKARRADIVAKKAALEKWAVYLTGIYNRVRLLGKERYVPHLTESMALTQQALQEIMTYDPTPSVPLEMAPKKQKKAKSKKKAPKKKPASDTPAPAPSTPAVAAALKAPSAQKT